MKTLKMACLAGVLCVMSGAAMVAQTADVVVAVSGVRADGGKVMASAGDMQDHEHMVYAMVDPTDSGELQIVLKDVPVGTCNVYVYQDMNGNMTLDMDEGAVPTEPCFMQQKVKVTADGVTIKARLVNVAEMMGK